MKMRNLVAFAMLALGAVAAPFAGHAEVSGGDIYSVDLSTKFGGVIPAPGTTLTIGEGVTVRIRLVNKMTSDNVPLDWRFVPDWPSGEVNPAESAFGPQLGLMLGGQQVFADYQGSEQTAVSGKNMFTDLYFHYTVKSGDLALPARFMTIEGKAVGGDDDATDYAIHYCNYLGAYWKLTNNNGAACVFHFCSDPLVPNPDPTWAAGEPHRYITGTGLGINVKTVDFDTTYFKDPSAPGVDDGVWRQLYVGLSTALPSLPTVKVDGFADVSATMYVWVENEDNDDPVAQVLTSDNPEKIVDPVDPTKYRWVIKVPIAKGAQSATFKLQGVREGKVKVRMSASRELSYNKGGDVIEDWVERNVSVVPPPDPYVMVETLNPAGGALEKSTIQLTADYENYAAMMKFTLLQEPSADLTVTLVPELDDGDIFEDGLLGLSLTTEDSPWLNEDLEFTVKKGDPLTRTIYVYAKGTTSKLASKGVTFTIETSGAPEYDGESGKHSCKLLVKPMNPVLVKPAAGDAITDAMAGKNYSLDIVISDARKYMVDAVEDEPYTVYWKVEALGTEGEWDSDDAVFLDDADTGEATISVPFDIEGECNLLLYVLSPSGKKSPTTTIPVTVAAPKRATVTLDRESGVYAEGETAYVNFHLTQKYKNELYAFLVPQDDDTKAKFETDISSEISGAIGYYIGPNETDTKIPAEIGVIDGKAIGRFQVFMCTTKNYSKTKSAGYIGDVFTISATNVVPTVNWVSMGGQDIKVNGGVTKTVAQGVEKVFRISKLTEPGQLDLDATGTDATGMDLRFLTQWKFGTGEWEDVYGNPNLSATVIKHTFNSPGDQTVTVRCQDKDMRKAGKWSEEFSFTVPVLDQPRVVITPVQGRRQYYEDETGADYAFNVTLTAAPDIGSSDRLNVEIRRELLGDASKYSVDDLTLSKDAVTFSGGTTSGPSFFLKQLDGTAESAASGFRIVAHVTNAGIDTEGKTWDDAELEVYILNRDPAILNPSEQSLDKDGKVIPTTTTIGAENTLAWSLKDVVADKKGMTVTWETSEGQRKTYKQGVDADDVMSGTHTFDFSSAGDKSITMSVLDKDGGTASRTFYYTIEASKTLELVPHGPPSGNGTPLSSRYHDKASGLGAGKVWADNVNFYRNWIFSGNCGVETSWRIYASGYAYGEHDVRPELGFDYTYMPEDGKDSFLYAWLQIAQEKDAAKPTDTYLAVVPEHRGAANSGTLISLPSEKVNTSGDGKSGGTYAKTSAEAIFAKEYLVSDNMGDINQDGVPDIYAKKYDFGIYSDDGNVAGDDLKAITAANENGNLDEDYLPTTGSSAYSTLIPGLPSSWADGTPFTAKTEIRGYGEALNDAPAQVGISDVAPERRYTDPRTDSRSTLDGLDPNGSQEPVEYYAWLEFAARSGLDPADEANWKLWSPERPTDPCSPDTDDDGFSDGYEYFFWYRAHVGYMENGVHRYLTGRAYDPKNPGEGKFISAEEIEALIDPLAASGDPSSAKLRDTDNDGLPDLLEFEIGTNPFDFDTDGDGLPDGFEIIIGGTDPLTAYTAKDAKHDAARNYDGDAMAFTSVKRESEVKPLPRFIQRYNTFATIEANGDTDGIQWYVETPLDGGVSAFTYTNGVPVAGVKFTVDGIDYVTTNWTEAAKLPLANGCLAVTLDPHSTFAVTNAAGAATALGVTFDGSVEWMLLRPTRILAGTQIEGTPAETVCANASIVDLAAKDKCNAAWVYGSENVKVSGHEFGFLALARYQLPKGADENAPGAVLAELPSKTRDVAFLHYLVYQQWGFDPRTAWNPNTPLAARWGSALEGQILAEQVGKLGYAGTSTRTRAFTAYDEFLLYSFFLNNGCDMSGWTTASEDAPYLAQTWMAFCTNPRGTGEPEWASDKHYEGWTAQRDENGCDTDLDGVPDGWELYVMAGPKKGADGKADPKNGMFNFAPPYAPFTAAGEELIEMPESYFSPFVSAAKDAATDNVKYIGKDQNDSLTEYLEFVGTDSCAYYDEVQDGAPAAYAKTPLLPNGWKWLNKFFPTDPWGADSDDDGIKDNEEQGAFAYAEDADVEGFKADKAKTVYPGCGLNPLSVDTDMDGLPDGWENQFAGSTVSSNSVNEGYIDGMDGTVADAQTSPEGPNRDYDRDGLENWQEYLTGTMRCWRYDDPFTQWGSIPFEAYYAYDLTSGYTYFDPDFEALGIEGEDDDERWNNFWYETLVHVGGPIYNPHLVFDQSPTAQYFSRVDKGWDPNYFDKVLMGDSDGEDTAGGEHHYYWFAHRIGAQKYTEAWAAAYGEKGWFSVAKIEPARYVSCSPICEDSDQDGLDDFYELFHGLNPLLGGDATPATINPCDLVWANKAIDKTGPAWYGFNPWTVRPFAKPRGTDPAFDFTVYPWKNGLQSADPDGDNERNYVEAIMAKFDSVTGYHGDPTPMWMTDTSYSNSLTRLHYRMPTRRYFAFMDTTVTDQNGDQVPGFTGPDGTAYFFRDFDAYSMNEKAPGTLELFGVDRWKIYTAPIDNRVSQLHYDRGQESVGSWLFSFEENEGYDTDHDGLNDEAEIAGRAHGATDPIDFDSPRRRQAMYFPGADSALQTPPQLIEEHPIVGGWYDEEFPFREYTVECWVKPDDLRDATIVERAIWTQGANAGDRELLRKNFQLAIRKVGDTAYWFTKFDSNGTGEKTSDEVAVISADEAVPGVWTHLAATFDGAHLTLYVNGRPSGTAADTTQSKQQPECGASVVSIRTGENSSDPGGLYKTDGYAYHAIVVGASVKTYADFPALPFTDQWCGYALNLYNAMGWRFYRDFFKGYVDEIRVWDGARSTSEIAGSMGVRYTAELAKENRSAVYKQWLAGMSRYRADGTTGKDYEGVVPELRYHFTFDSLLAADNAKELAKVPTGFANGPSAPYARPEGYEVGWWKRVLDAYGSAYAGNTNYVTWIPNTVAHLPRFDGTTLDSAFWSADFAGDTPGTYAFANAAEPYSMWTQWWRGNIFGEIQTTFLRYSLASSSTNEVNSLMNLFMFTGRNQLCEGCDLLPLGGAFARYCDAMWDGQGAGTVHETTGNDADSDGLPNWWEKYADEQYRGDLDPSVKISWDTIIDYDGRQITAGEAYLRDLAKGAYVDANGTAHFGPTEYAQTAKTDGLIPDWWKELMKIVDADPLSDLDNDGLNNYVEYVASELLPFQLYLSPTKASSDTKTLDYFRKIGRLYLGEMLTDHDQMEDHWERSLGDESIASAALWDALKDGEEDGWNNFAEARYNGYTMSTFAQLVAHAMGDNEVLDAPIPSIRMKARYNGDRPLILDSQTASGGAAAVIDGSSDTECTTPALIVTAFSKNADTGSYVLKPDAIWAIRPGVPVTKEVYLGGWEDRVVRGTMAPGNIDIGTLDIKFAQVPQSDLYSWTDESGTHLAGTYAEFKAAFDKNPDIIQNIQNFEWLSLYAPMNEYTSSDRAVTVTRDALTQKGYIAVYGERVGTVDLTTGEFEFDLGAMNRLRYNYTYDGGKGPAAAWSYKEAIFKITYTATVPSSQLSSLDFSLAKSDPNIITPDGHVIKASFVRGGLNSFQAFYDLNDNGIWDPGEPFGVVNDVEIGWANHDVEIELSDMSAVTPRVKLWGAGGESSGGGNGDDKETASASAADSDRGTRVGVETFSDVSNRFEIANVTWPKTRVRVVRYKVDKFPVYKVGVNAGVVLEKDFEQTSRDFLHEGDFLADGDLDIDWKNLYTDVVNWQGAQMAACEVTNVTYLIVYNWDKSEYASDKDTNTQVKANATLVTRRFEVRRSVPTPCPERAVYNHAQPTFAWRIDNEDKWASWFGTTYTAFKVRVKDESGNLIYDSGIRRLPAKDSEGVYTWTAPLYVGEKVPGTGVTFSNLTKYQWEVAVYNAKFKTDTLVAMETQGNPFSAAETFRMNVTDLDASSSALAVRICYAGPATKLAGRVRAEAFTSPDFTGDPVAVATLDAAAQLSPSGTVANTRMIGLPSGKYFVRAYIDTNQNGVHDDWESWGYLNERDLASKPGIFNPVALESSVNPSVENVRKVLIEDCDTDGDWFPDVWEAEQNGDRFDRTKISPVKGDAELIGVNTNLDANLTKTMQGVNAMMSALKSANGVSLMTGVARADVKSAANGGFEVKSEVKSETLTIVGLSVDSANGRVLLKVGAETTANVDPTVASFLNVTVRKGAEVTVKVEHAESPAGPWNELPGVGGTVTVDRAGSDIEVKLDGELPAQGYFRAKIEE